jgi:hypothetical protein
MSAYTGGNHDDRFTCHVAYTCATTGSMFSDATLMQAYVIENSLGGYYGSTVSSVMFACSDPYSRTNGTALEVVCELKDPSNFPFTVLWVILGFMGAGLLAGLFYCCCAPPRTPVEKRGPATVNATVVAPIPFLALEKC